MDTGYSIRAAEERDVDRILEGVKEVAASENMSHAIRIDRKDLADHLSSPWFSGAVLEYRPSVEEPPEVVGHMLWNYCFSTWVGRMAFLQDFYVRSDHRGRGCGSSLMQGVAKICNEKGCRRLRWTVPKKNQSAKEFFSKMRAENLSETDDWEMMSVEGEKFLELVQGKQKVPFLSSP